MQVQLNAQLIQNMSNDKDYYYDVVVFLLDKLEQAGQCDSTIIDQINDLLLFDNELRKMILFIFNQGFNKPEMLSPLIKTVQLDECNELNKLIHLLNFAILAFIENKANTFLD
jgi:hypothetical protein